MSSERWERMETLFHRALEATPEARTELLRQHCGDDDELFDAVRSLLDSDVAVTGFLDGPLADVRLPAADVSEAEGESRLGPYRLVRVLGEGGMSTVYLAEQVEPGFQRKVALKVIRQGMESTESRRRMLRERQILAGLEHPNIARLYGGGVTESGLPYFAMEVVEGLPIDRHCDDARLGLNARLVLFLEVCEAVNFAHQRLVVHRDLKPSNILVGANGKPRLLDFGIAKWLSEEASGGQEATAAWLRLITPHYASPEQVCGLPVTTASDVYSLGVLLYLLLTGGLPHDLEGLSLPEIERVVRERSPAPPSARLRDLPRKRAREVSECRELRPETLERRLAGDLDTIVLRAMHPDPGRRYRSVEALASDLRRFLDGFPVRARAGSLTYRVGKFVRRNIYGAAASAVIALSLIGGGLVFAHQAEQTRFERDRLREVLAFVEQVFSVAGSGEELSVREALDRGADLLKHKLEGHPRLQASLHHVVGNLYLSLGANARAREHLERAVALRREVFGAPSLELAESSSALSVALILTSREEAEARAALELATEAVAHYRRVLGSRDPNLVRPLNNLVTILCYLDDNETARAPAEEALSLAREFLPPERPELANALTHHALLLTRRGEHAAAIEAYREALELHRSYLGDPHVEVTAVLSNLATAHDRLGQKAEAEATLRRTLELERQIYSGDSSYLAQTLLKLGSVLTRTGKLDEAESLFLESLEILSRLREPTDYSVALVRSAYAEALIRGGRELEAETLLREHLAGWREHLAGTPYVALVEGALGASLSAQARFQEAEPLLLASHRTLLDLRGESVSETATAAHRLAELYEAWDRPKDAARFRTQSR